MRVLNVVETSRRFPIFLRKLGNFIFYGHFIIPVSVRERRKNK